LFDFFKQGGGRINRKLLLSVLIFFSLALVLNVSASSAASVNQTNMSTNAISSNNVNDNISSSNYATDKVKSTVNTSVKIASTNATKIKINSTMAAGEPILVNGLTLTQLKDGVSRTQTFFNTYKRLPNYVSFGTRQIAIATFQKNIATQGLKINTVIVNGLTVAQMKDGISRAQTFYSKYGRLPFYISFGTRQIAIATFQKNIATQGLKINTVSVNPKPVIDTSSVAALAKSLTTGSTSTYDSAVSLFNWVRNNISYSFYYNTKYGAAGTLKYRTANCCDYSNLLVALARSAGITARYVHGTCQFSSGTWYGHVWTQLYVNGKWYNADAISTRNTFGVINNWNTATYKLNGYYTTLPF
jgi:uncharacterized protein YjfI (DUF2170 family)